VAEKGRGRPTLEAPGHGPWPVTVALADGHAEQVATLHMIELRGDRCRAITLGADKAYDAEDSVNGLRR
jgi:hypothetical protein